MRCGICKTDLGIKGRNPGGCLCRECTADVLHPGEPVEKDWQRCQINGKWTGILHVPSCTIFEIDRKALTSRIRVRANGRVKPTAEELEDLRQMALVLFVSGNVSRHSPSFIAGEHLKVLPMRVAPRCRHLRGLHL
jgi:hypothetical protein